MRIRCYSKSELAMMYFPESSAHVATNRLARWINMNPKLCMLLDELGYVKKSRYFTAKQVEAIIDCLGEP